MSDHYQNWRDWPIEFLSSPGLTPYEQAVRFMEARVEAILAGNARELLWFVEHPPLYTGGSSAKPEDLLQPNRFPVYKTRRGGQYTYHGPGQRVAYIMLDLNCRHKDVRRYVADLEGWVIKTLAQFNVAGEIREGRVGVWVDRTRPGTARREDKIAAIGVRLRRWVTFHGIALNVEPDLEHFSGITPCGIAEQGLGVTSLVDLGWPVTMEEADEALKTSFSEIFGPLG
ncbi:MAG: lipoyl(octanoyl) transferase LipB [bacterium]